MSSSAEFITGTVFAAVMVLIGLGAIWIVRWQTYFLLRHQGTSSDEGSVCLLRTGAFFCSRTVHSSLSGHDLEDEERPPEPAVPDDSSIELAPAPLSPATSSSSKWFGPTMVDDQAILTAMLPLAIVPVSLHGHGQGLARDKDLWPQRHESNERSDKQH